MTREDEIAKLDLNQAKANFEIETDEGRHDEPPVMDFDRLGICKKCRLCRVSYGSYEVRVRCGAMFSYIRNPKDMIYCEDNARVTEVMKPYYERK